MVRALHAQGTPIFHQLWHCGRASHSSFPVASRLSLPPQPNGNFNDMGSPDFRETFAYAAWQLARHRLAYLHVVDGLAFGRP